MERDSPLPSLMEELPWVLTWQRIVCRLRRIRSFVCGGWVRCVWAIVIGNSTSSVVVLLKLCTLLLSTPAIHFFRILIDLWRVISCVSLLLEPECIIYLDMKVPLPYKPITPHATGQFLHFATALSLVKKFGISAWRGAEFDNCHRNAHRCPHHNPVGLASCERIRAWQRWVTVIIGGYSKCVQYSLCSPPTNGASSTSHKFTFKHLVT
jgi:hypothetical protein